MQPRSQRIAVLAHKRVTERAKDADIEKYKSLVLSLPDMIRHNGLAQTTGFLLSKTEAHFEKVSEDFIACTQSYSSLSSEKFHDAVIESDLDEIMIMTREALEISGWLRRYVQGILKLGVDGTSSEKSTQETEVQQ